MQSVSSRIWTRIAAFISYGDNDYTTGTSSKQDQGNNKIIPVQLFSSQPGTTRCRGSWQQVHCRGEAATIYPAITLVSSSELNEAYAAESPWGLVDDTLCTKPIYIEECDQHDFWLCLAFFSLHKRCILPLTALALGFRVVLENLRLITSDKTPKLVRFNLTALDDILTQLHAVHLLLIIIQQSVHDFCSDFPYTQIFRDNLPNTVRFYV